MPKLFEIFGYRFYFYSDEGQPLEPVHVHVARRTDSASSKFWITSDGDVIMENNNAHFTDRELKKIIASVKAYESEIVQSYEAYFGEDAAYIDNDIDPMLKSGDPRWE